MPKTRQEKEKKVEELTDKLSRMKSAIFVDYSGLDVKSVEELRKTLRQEKIDYQVIKKTLLKLALAKIGLKDIDFRALEGQLGITFDYQDEVMPARLLKIFQKKNTALKILGGILEKKFIGKEKVQELASIPTRSDLLTKATGSLKAPLTGLVNVLQGNIKKLIYTLMALKD